MERGPYIWEVPGKRLSVHLRPDVIEALRHSVPVSSQNHRSGRTGILLGYKVVYGGRSKIVVEDFELACATGQTVETPLAKQMKLADIAGRWKNRQSLRYAVGSFRWFDSQEHSPALTQEDLDASECLFPSGDSIFLLIPSSAEFPPIGTFFLGAGQEIPAQEPGYPLPPHCSFLPMQLNRGGQVVEGAAETLSVETDITAGKPRAAARSYMSAAGRWFWLSIGAGAVIAGGILLFQPPDPRESLAREIAFHSPKTEALGLKVQPGERLLEVSWNDLSPNIMAAQSGSLTIEDGFGRKTFRLDAAQLRNKRIFYSPVSSDVNIRLEVVGGSGRSAVESVRFVGSLNPLPGEGPLTRDANPAVRSVSRNSAVKRLPVRLDGKRGPNDYLAPTVATSSISDRQTGETVGKVDQRFQELSAVAPEILRIVRPFISADALKSRLSPTEVNVNLNIDEHGAVTKAELDPGSKAVSAAVKEAALAAAKRWQFRPAQRDGENISSQFAIRFRFQPVNQ